jgi:hypothetical protein
LRNFGGDDENVSRAWDSIVSKVKSKVKLSLGVTKYLAVKMYG